MGALSFWYLIPFAVICIILGCVIYGSFVGNRAAQIVLVLFLVTLPFLLMEMTGFSFYRLITLVTPQTAQPINPEAQKTYELCMSGTNKWSCAFSIHYISFTPQQRDNIREKLRQVWPERIPDQLNYLLNDGEGTSRNNGCTKCLETAQADYRRCIDGHEEKACIAMLLGDYSTSQQRRGVREELNRIKPGLVNNLVKNLSPSAVIAATPATTLTAPQQAEQAFLSLVNAVGTVFEIGIGLIVLFIAYIFYLKFSQKSAEKEAWNALPVDGPMKASIEEQHVEPGTFNSKHVRCGLKIDVKICQNDWRAIANAGLMKYALFNADGPSGKQYDPENIRPWLVEDLKRPTYASFWDVQRMQDAKEQLLQNLVNLRAQIESLKERDHKTEFEI